MTTRRLRVAGALLALLSTAACAPAAKGDPAAVKAVESQICGLVSDDAVSPAEVTSLGKILDRAHQLGLPDGILDPSHEIVQNGAATPAEIKALRSACA
jgi:hypothetical protein